MDDTQSAASCSRESVDGLGVRWRRAPLFRPPKGGDDGSTELAEVSLGEGARGVGRTSGARALFLGAPEPKLSPPPVFGGTGGGLEDFENGDRQPVLKMRADG